jgi:putative glycosyltransferase (TIGR04372 family)
MKSGMPPRIKAVLRHAFHAPWAIAFCLAIRLLRPFVLVKVGTFHADRIGHFTVDSILTWRKLRIRRDRVVPLVWLPPSTSNEFWTKLVARHFRVHAWFKYADFWNRRLPFGAAHVLLEHEANSRDLEGICRIVPERFAFQPEEDARARDWLRAKGWRDGEPIVCLLIRDGAYLRSEAAHKNSRDWSYHDHRDSEIADYVPAIEFLLGQGAWVFRMGKIMRARAPVDAPCFVDYAFDPSKSDFMDIWLFSNCDLCVTTGTGPDGISAAYDIQMIEVNTVGIFAMRLPARSVYAPKRMVWKNSGRELTLPEQIQCTLMNGHQFDGLGIALKNLEAAEILDVVREGWSRRYGTWRETSEQAARERRFWEVYRAHPRVHALNPWYHPDCHPAAAWLRYVPIDDADRPSA